ncbi:hypothetical protein GOV11_01925 [Candidatus Woesearchaeota archaeon]|nr:hypothetical protein [Candidatus Woesearchaeota archaeon]
MFDLVFPKGNETKLVEMAKELGFTELMLCYSLSDKMLKQRVKEVQTLSKGIAVSLAVLVKNQQDVQKARAFTRNIIGIGKTWIFEDKRVSHVINFESGKREDFIHHRNSGLSQVSIKNCMRTDKIFLVNIAQLHCEQQHIILGRMMQNNRFFKKYKPKVNVVSGAAQALEMRAPKDLENFLSL